MFVMIFGLYREIKQKSEIYPDTEIKQVENEKASDIEMKNVFTNESFTKEIDETK